MRTDVRTDANVSRQCNTLVRAGAVRLNPTMKHKIRSNLMFVGCVCVCVCVCVCGIGADTGPLIQVKLLDFNRLFLLNRVKCDTCSEILLFLFKMYNKYFSLWVYGMFTLFVP